MPILGEIDFSTISKSLQSFCRFLFRFVIRLSFELLLFFMLWTHLPFWVGLLALDRRGEFWSSSIWHWPLRIPLSFGFVSVLALLIYLSFKTWELYIMIGFLLRIVIWLLLLFDAWIRRIYWFYAGWGFYSYIWFWLYSYRVFSENS